MNGADDYLAALGDLPIAEAANGDWKALHGLAAHFLEAGKSGLISFDEGLTTALLVGRMAACHGHADALYAMAVYLGHHAQRASTEAARTLRAAEAVMWANRAAEAGHGEMDRQVLEFAAAPGAAHILEMAAQMERKI